MSTHFLVLRVKFTRLPFYPAIHCSLCFLGVTPLLLFIVQEMHHDQPCVMVKPGKNKVRVTIVPLSRRSGERTRESNQLKVWREPSRPLPVGQVRNPRATKLILVCPTRKLDRGSKLATEARWQKARKLDGRKLDGRKLASSTGQQWSSQAR